MERSIHVSFKVTKIENVLLTIYYPLSKQPFQSKYNISACQTVRWIIEITHFVL